MIVPRTRLLVLVAVILLPCAVVGALVPDVALACIAIAVLFAAITTTDALLARGALNGIAIETPPVLRLVAERPAEIPLKLTNASPAPKPLRIGLPLPAEISSHAPDVTLIAPPGVSRAVWACTPSRRGRYVLDAVYLETSSLLGLWSRRVKSAVRSELRVYPNLRKEHIETLFLNRGNFGVHLFRQVGKGREFEKLREYAPGDGFDEIDWKATARRARPITRVFQIERTQEVYAVIDTSRLSARGATLDRFVSAALALGLAAERQGDLFGLVAFSDKLRQFVRARNGKPHYNSCRDALYYLEAEKSSPDFDELCTFLRLRLRRRALLIFLTELDDPVLAESFIRNIKLISRQHLVLVNMLRPVGATPLFHDTDVHETDDVYRRLAGHLQWQKLRETEKVLGNAGVRFSLLDPARLSAELIAAYQNIKARQLI
jgi:uncharacterized protein (DUF58 family)